MKPNRTARTIGQIPGAYHALIKRIYAQKPMQKRASFGATVLSIVIILGLIAVFRCMIEDLLN